MPRDTRMGDVYKVTRQRVFRTTLLLKTKPGDVVMQWGSGDLGRVAGPVWTFVETNHDGDIC